MFIRMNHHSVILYSNFRKKSARNNNLRSYMQIKATNSVIVGDPIIPIDHSKTADKAHNIIVGDPINPNSPIKGLVDDTNTVIVGEPWSRFIKDNNSNNSGGA